MSSNSSRKRRSRKAADRPKKPYPEFPLTPHASGAWQKKIRSKIHYFGKWARRVHGKLKRIEGDGWKEALEEYKAVADDLHAGRTLRVKNDGLTVADLCNHFLTAKLRKQEAGELGVRMYAEYKEVTDLIVAAFGNTRLVDDLAADDFEKLRADMAERWGPVRLGNAITRVKSVFKYGLDNRLIEKASRATRLFGRDNQQANPEDTVLETLGRAQDRGRTQGTEPRAGSDRPHCPGARAGPGRRCCHPGVHRTSRLRSDGVVYCPAGRKAARSSKRSRVTVHGPRVTGV
jgi:hypothetical protein